MKYALVSELQDQHQVTPLAGVWVEIKRNKKGGENNPVTPLAGVWVEMCMWQHFPMQLSVTPLAGVWVEMRVKVDFDYNPAAVTPLAGVWVEIGQYSCGCQERGSLPLRECGLK